MTLEPQDSFPSVGKLDDAQPCTEWKTQQLGQYAKCQDDLCAGLGRKMAIHRFREGHALTLAFEQIGYGGWTPFLKQHGISHSSADRARKLYARAGNEDNLVGFTVMDAYEAFEIDRPVQQSMKRPERKKSSTSPPTTGRSANRRTPLRHYCPDESKPHTPALPEVKVDDASSEVDRILRAFSEFAAARRWDDSRKVQVMAELSFPEPLRGMVEDLVAVGSGDEMIAQLHRYYQEPDLWTLVLEGKAEPDQIMPAINAKIEELKRKVMEQDNASSPEQGGKS